MSSPALFPPLSFRAIVTPGLTTVRRYWKPFILLQIAALSLALGYYHVPVITRACTALTDMQQRWGAVFAAVTAGIAGSLLPDLSKRIVRRHYRVSSREFRDLFFTFFAFGFSGVFTSCQYRMFAWIYGDGHDTATVIKKVLSDQFITTPIYGTPFWVVVYLWRRNRYRPLRTLCSLTPRWYLIDVLPLLVTGWCFWIPACSVAYSMPTSLQFVMFCFALAGWSLLMTFVAEQPILTTDH